MIESNPTRLDPRELERVDKYFSGVPSFKNARIEKTGHSVVVHLPAGDNFGLKEDRFSMYWDKGKREWIGDHYRLWSESLTCGDMDGVWGPYKLNEECAKILREQYGISEEKISFEEVLLTEPSQLEKIAL